MFLLARAKRTRRYLIMSMESRDIIGERSEPLSKVFDDQSRDIYIYGGVLT